MSPEEIREIVKEEIEKMVGQGSVRAIHHSQLTPKLIKQRHIDGAIIKIGTAADLPTSDSTGILAHFQTDTGVLSIWDGTQWLDTTLT